MLKKLDILILKAFFGPFIATFFVTLLVLVLQFFWLYIDDFVGKGLSPGIIMEFIWYQSATLIPLALPLAVLLSSLMTFGNLAESFELVAIKSAGISLLRFMRPLFITTMFICGIAFMFANYIIPVANLKSKTLLSDIVDAKPAFDLKEGVFYDKIRGFSIKIGNKENDSIIRDVIVYDQSNTVQDNFISASSGIMRLTENKRFLEFNLKNGWRYEERAERGVTNNSEYIRIGFKEYKTYLDLSSLEFTRTADSVYKNNQKMLSIRQLENATDSIRKDLRKIEERTKREVMASLPSVNKNDTGFEKEHSVAENRHVSRQDTGKHSKAPKLEDLLPDSSISMVNQNALSKMNMVKLNNDIIVMDLQAKQKDLRLHQIEWHRKLTLSLACIVLFLIGAPLGSIIRRGGLGTPLVISVVFFIVYYFISNSGEKFAKEGALQPWLGMWLATLLLIPIGIFFTYKALHDSQLFNREFYYRMWNNLRAVIRRK